AATAQLSHARILNMAMARGVHVTPSGGVGGWYCASNLMCSRSRMADASAGVMGPPGCRGRGRSPARWYWSDHLEPGHRNLDCATLGFEDLCVLERHGEGASAPVARAGLAVLVVADPELEGALGGVAVPAVHVVS